MSDRNKMFAAVAKLVGEVRQQIEEKFDVALVSIREELDALKSRPVEKGAPGPAGDRGEQGPAGEPGQRGEKGEPGADRPLVEPVAIRAGAEYPKNTAGKFAGGLWIARKAAIGDPSEDPHAWDCVLAGIEDADVHQVKGQKFALTLRLSNGEQLQADFRLPFPLHKGVYQEDETYFPGEVITKGSAMWQALEKTDHAPPGNGWQQILVAPRGKQGAAGKDGAPAPTDDIEAIKAELKSLRELREFFEDLRDGLVGDDDD